MNYIGDFIAGSTITFAITTNAASGAAVAPSSGFEAADLIIYKNSSATQRTSANGVTMTSPFDSITGLHMVAIDLTDNTDAGFWAIGNDYHVVLSPDETIDSQTVVAEVAHFSIQNRLNVTNLTLPAGPIPNMGIADNGTAQSATGTTLVLRSAASFADNTCTGMILAVLGSTQGYWQCRVVDSNVGSTDTLTISPAFGVTPSGTITYILFDSPPASTGALPAVNTTQLAGQTVTAASGVTFPASIASATTVAAILAMLDDPRAEPGQGNPPVNGDMATKLDYLYKAWRNRSTQTSTTYSLYADDGTTVDQKATASDNGTTFDRTEIVTGP